MFCPVSRIVSVGPLGEAHPESRLIGEHHETTPVDLRTGGLLRRLTAGERRERLPLQAPLCIAVCSGLCAGPGLCTGPGLRTRPVRPAAVLPQEALQRALPQAHLRSGLCTGSVRPDRLCRAGTLAAGLCPAITRLQPGRRTGRSRPDAPVSSCRERPTTRLLSRDRVSFLRVAEKTWVSSLSRPAQHPLQIIITIDP